MERTAQGICEIIGKMISLSGDRSAEGRPASRFTTPPNDAERSCHGVQRGGQEPAAVEFGKHGFALRRREAPPVDLLVARQAQLGIVYPPDHPGLGAPALRQVLQHEA